MKQMPKRHQLKIEYVKKILKVISQDKNIIFRGGTALSLTYGAIHRYSEDIDVSLMKTSNLSPNGLVKWLTTKLEECGWVEKINFIEDSNFLNVHFSNPHPTESSFEAFVDDVITIEMPNSKRGPEEVSYSMIKPFEEADFEMNVMDIQNIFSDKICIVFELFLRNKGFSWAERDQKLGRHIYDTQMLCELSTQYQLSHITRRMGKFVRNYIINPEAPQIQNGSNNVKELIGMSAKAIFAIFVEEIDKSWKIIEVAVGNLVYPGADKLSKKQFVKNYESILKKLISITKDEISKQKPEK